MLNLPRLVVRPSEGLAPSADNGLWTPRQLGCGLLLATVVIVGGMTTSCTTADRVTATERGAAASVVGPAIGDPNAVGEPVDNAPEAAVAVSELDHCLRLLLAADDFLDRTECIRATFHKRERLGGRLEEQNVMLLKVRREPMAVYMRWQQPDPGREAIWQANADDAQILVHPGGWKRKFAPLVKVDPYGARAAEGGRRPIDTSGPWHFSDRLITIVKAQKPDAVDVTLDEHPLYASQCHRFTLLRTSTEGGDFHKAVIYIEKDRLLPIGFDMYSPPAEDSTTPVLEESYAYANLELDPSIEEIEFSTTNPKYQYHGR